MLSVYSRNHCPFSPESAIGETLAKFHRIGNKFSTDHTRFHIDVEWLIDKPLTLLDRYLRNERKSERRTDEEILLENLNFLFPEDSFLKELIESEQLSFESSSIDVLDNLRDYLFQKENILRKLM